MDIKAAFPSDYLKASDLQNRRIAAEIDKVVVKNIGNDKRPVVYFKNKEKGLVLKKTNANMIQEIAGSAETGEWAGVQIVLFSTKVDFQGRRVDGIRVDRVGNEGDIVRANPKPADDDIGF
jgi:hypothetical protein